MRFFSFIVVVCLAVVAGCSEPGSGNAPVSAQATLERIEATLAEACRLEEMGDRDAAQAAWRRAHAQFEAELEPALREGLGDVPSTGVEYRFGQLRRALDSGRGRPRVLTEALAEDLRSAVEALPPPEVE